MHAIPVVDALSTVSPCVDIFHVDPSHSQDSVERRVRKQCLMNRVDFVQHGACDESRGSAHCCQRSWWQGTSCATGPTCHSLRSNKVASKIGRTLETHHFSVGHVEKSRSHVASVADLDRDQHRHGGRVVVTFPWTWHVLATWPIQSVLTEAPFFVCS